MKQKMNRRSTYSALATLTLTISLLAPQVSSATPSNPGSNGIATNSATVDRAADSVENYPTPTPRKVSCGDAELNPESDADVECKSIEVPLDYDETDGKKIDVVYLRRPAKDQENKIGTLFLNPGGPGGSAVNSAARAPKFMSPELMEKFDIVGVDPRGVNLSSKIRCFPNADEQTRAISLFQNPLPVTPAQIGFHLDSAAVLGQACSTHGQPLIEHMSTANVARDMEVMRRVVGDKQLTFLGFSYGSYLGNVYANLYPDRVRAIAIDGIVDPVGWAGTPENRNIPYSQRLQDGKGGTAALDEIFRLCELKGPQFCMFASKGDPQDNYRRIIDTLKKTPILIPDRDTGEILIELNYQALIGFVNDWMMTANSPDIVSMNLTFVYEILFEGAAPGTTDAALQDGMLVALAKQYKQMQAGGSEPEYENFLDAFYAVACTDSLDPLDVGEWPEFAEQAKSLWGEFGEYYAWGSAPCAENSWTAKDGDAYRGPFTHETANPVLVIGNYWDPATSYTGAEDVAKQLPNSRLLSSDNFGHTAYGTSECLTGAVNTYLLTTKLVPEGTVCQADLVPFSTPLQGDGGPRDQDASPTEMLTEANEELEKLDLPPVVPPQSGATPQP